MSNDYILIFDSGSGGEYVLDICRAILPSEKFVFYKDAHNCPYGDKSFNNLKRIFFDTLRRLSIKYNFKAVVIACNTMSSMFGDRLKHSKMFKKVFLITPQVSRKILSQKTLIIATSNTCRYNKKLLSFRKNRNLTILPLPSFARDIDNARYSGHYTVLQRDINSFLSPYISARIKNVVLGCTHYNYILPQIENALGPVKFYENSPSIVLKLKKYLEANSLLSTSGEVIILESI